jgi:O-antigen/teichoic acid export membrane protein
MDESSVTADRASAPSQGKFLAQASVNLISDGVTHACGLLGGFFLAKFLTPSLYGTIQGFKILYAFVPFASLGADSGTTVNIAIERGKNGEEAAKVVAGTGFWLYMVPQAICCLGLVAWSLLGSSETGWLRWGYAASAVSVFILALKQILSLILVGREQIRQRALAGMVHGLMGLAATIPAAYFLGVPAFWLADWASSVALLLLASAVGASTFRLFSWEKAKQIYRSGFVIFIGSQISVLLAQADRMVILSLLGTEALGFYGVGGVATRGLLVLGGAITAPWTPRVLRMLTAGQVVEVRKHSHHLAKALTWFGVYLALYGGGFICLMVPWLLPKYLAAIPVSLVFVVPLPMVCCMYSVNYVAFHFGWYGRILLLNLLLVADAFALDRWAVSQGWGITGIAAMTGLVQTMQAAAVLYLTWRLLGDGVGRCLRRMLGYMFPLAVLLMGVPICFLAVLALAPGGYVRDILATIALFTAVTSPALYGLGRDLELRTRFRAALQSRGYLPPGPPSP